MNFKFQLGSHMARAGFPSGDLFPPHMLSFKHLNSRLGLPCPPFVGRNVAVGRIHTFHHGTGELTTVKNGLPLTSFPFACLFCHCMCLMFERRLFYLSFISSFPVLLCPSLLSCHRLRSSLICTFWKPVVCLNATCTPFNLLHKLANY